jgi:hypothetical protein
VLKGGGQTEGGQIGKGGKTKVGRQTGRGGRTGRGTSREGVQGGGTERGYKQGGGANREGGKTGRGLGGTDREGGHTKWGWGHLLLFMGPSLSVGARSPQALSSIHLRVVVAGTRSALWFEGGHGGRTVMDGCGIGWWYGSCSCVRVLLFVGGGSGSSAQGFRLLALGGRHLWVGDGCSWVGG